VRRECLDWIPTANRRQLQSVLRVFVDHYNGHRPHRALDLAAPDQARVTPLPATLWGSRVTRRDPARRTDSRVPRRAPRPDRIAPTPHELQGIAGSEPWSFHALLPPS
jgi:hypothetical protein